MAKHIHIHLAPTRKTKDAAPSPQVGLTFWHRLWGTNAKVVSITRGNVSVRRVDGKGDTYVIEGNRWNGIAEPARSTKDAVSESDKQNRIKRLVARFKVTPQVAKEELIAEEWDEESAAINLRAMRREEGKDTSDALRTGDKVKVYCPGKPDHGKDGLIVGVKPGAYEVSLSGGVKKTFPSDQVVKPTTGDAAGSQVKQRGPNHWVILQDGRQTAEFKGPDAEKKAKALHRTLYDAS